MLWWWSLLMASATTTTDITVYKPSILSDAYKTSSEVKISFGDVAGEPTVTTIALSHGGHGTASVQWAAGTLLAHLIAGGGIDDSVRWPESPTAVEIGSGLGLVSIVAAKRGAGLVLATDGEPTVLPLLQQNLDANAPKGVAHATLLAWGDKAHARAVAARLPAAGADVVLASDIVYGSDRAVHHRLVQTLRDLCPTPRTVLVLAQTSRYPEKEQWFFTRLLKYFEGATLGRDAVRAGLRRAGYAPRPADAQVSVWVLRRRKVDDNECEAQPQQSGGGEEGRRGPADVVVVPSGDVIDPAQPDKL